MKNLKNYDHNETGKDSTSGGYNEGFGFGAGIDGHARRMSGSGDSDGTGKGCGYLQGGGGAFLVGERNGIGQGSYEGEGYEDGFGEGSGVADGYADSSGTGFCPDPLDFDLTY